MGIPTGQQRTVGELLALRSSACSLSRGANSGRRGSSSGLKSAMTLSTCSASRSSWPANTRRRNVVCVRGASDPVSRRRWISRWTHARLTSYFAATASASKPESHAFATRFRRSIEYGAMAPPATEVPRRPYYVQEENALVTPA